jgi:hypothetical protein
MRSSASARADFVSRSRQSPDQEAIIYLVQPLLTGSFCLPTQRILCRHSDEPSFNAGIHGISACKVYPPRQSPARAVGSYPTFSPSPSRLPGTNPPMPRLRRTKAVIFCGTVCSHPPDKSGKQDPAVHRYIALCCPDFPLPDESGGDSPVCS